MKYIGWLLPPIIALTLLTRLPLFSLLPLSIKQQVWTQQHQGDSVLWYPAVGLLLASILVFVFWVLAGVEPLLLAAILLLVWVGLTGALHLDGFADSIDAGYAAHRYLLHQVDEQQKQQQQNKVLAIFKDPRSGSMAVVGLVLLLLVKFTALVTLIEQAPSVFILGIVLALVLSRALAIVLLMSTDYVGEGLGRVLKDSLPQDKAFFLLIVLALLMWWLLPFFYSVILIVILALLLFAWRNFWQRSIGGIVGDCIGALIEMAELAILLIFCLLPIAGLSL